MFYAAVHLVNAHLVQKTNVSFDPKAAPAAHQTRSEAMRRCPELGKATVKYRELKDLSEAVRYDAGYVFDVTVHTVGSRDGACCWL
jgi:hypothetical protein